MLILRVGDPHVQVKNIDESEKLMQFVSEKALELKVDRIELLGDLTHTHSVLRLEVLDFWKDWLETLSDICEVVVLVGNHDQSGNANDGLNSLSIFNKLKKRNLKIVEFGTLIGQFAYMPYERDSAKFLEVVNGMANDHGANVLVCHQTIKGSKYENGFYAPDGVDSELISEKFVNIISGHIHSRQEFGRVIYPGTARWDTVSDANQLKGITYYSHEDATGRILDSRFISTEGICSPIIKLVLREGEEDLVIKENSRTTIELVGSSEWITKQKIKLRGKAHITTKIIDKQKRENRKSGNSLSSFVLQYFEPTNGITKESLLKYMQELKIV